MITAMTVWENRISPVFDSSRTLLIAEIKEKKISKRRYESFNPNLTSSLTDRLSALRVDVLICGAISQVPADVIENHGIKLIPFITGEAEEILAHWASGTSLVPLFLMPGCGCRSKKRCGRKGKHGVTHPDAKEVSHMPRGDGTGPKGRGPGNGRGKGNCKSGRGCGGSGKKPDKARSKVRQSVKKS